MTQICECERTESEITPQQWQKIDEIIQKHKLKKGSLIPVLQQVQEVTGYLPSEVQQRIAEGLGISTSMVYGVVSFYAFFTMVPRGRHTIKVCLGTACYVRRSNEILENLKNKLDVEVGGTTKDRKFSLEGVRCVGACGIAPVVMVNEDTYGNLDPVKASQILEKYE
jgi:NADH-quinone oxidoreductase E subunit